jgi:hypothetical protein
VNQRIRLCQCGCGRELPPLTRTYPNGRVVKNVAIKFLPGHNGRKLTRYIIDANTGCWLWQLSLSIQGYGMLQLNFGRDKQTGKRRVRTMVAHKLMWETKYGPVPKGLELDHLCRNPRCVNPEHLEAVTHEENMRRAKHVRLSVDLIKLCIEKREDGYTYDEIGDELGVHRTTVSKAINGVNWRGVC